MSDLLQVRDARLAFGGLQALGGVSLDIPDGSIVGLIGPNGAGKTTLFNCISGLQRLDTGTITFKGDDVTALITTLREDRQPQPEPARRPVRARRQRVEAA